MYLKKLELVGFKSFPEKTPFLFNEGVTCIVGPNGCGKTNLLDALRWVLGEQKSSLLRGNKMEEVIFAGTKSLKPLGMAEVSLHIENRSGILPSPYHDLTISRRLFRSGDSEYLLNKVPCRLKDITDLFADTGLGSHAYAIIQQDMIDAILSDRAEDRRFLFEEAAGITKYKHRRKAAERKLEATEHDLLRLKDILAEVTTHVNSLKRQVNKAERYKLVSDELKRWALFQSATRYCELRDAQKELALAIRLSEDHKLALQAQLDGHFADLEAQRTAQAELDRDLSDLSAKIYAMSEQAHALETEISVSREKKENFVITISRNHEEIDALNKRAEVIREERGRCQGEIEAADQDISRVARQLDEAALHQKTADAEYLAYRSTVEDESEKLLDLEGKLSSGRTDSANLEEQVRELDGEIVQQNQRKSGLIEEKVRRRQDIAALQQQINGARDDIASGESSLAAREAQLEEALAAADRLRDQQAELSSTYEATSARRNLLGEMIERHEGYGSGVVAVFDVADRWPDISGAVADLIRPHDGYGPALEAALGETAQYILCRTQSTAQEIIGHLRASKAGRATFLILEKLPEPTDRPSLPAIQGVRGWADSLVSCDDHLRSVPLALLGHTAVCESSDTASQLATHLPAGYRTVTLAGDVYSGSGVITGGASEELSLLGRKDEVDLLGQKLAELEAQLSQTKKQHAETTLLIAEIRQVISVANQKLADDKDRLSELASKLKEEQFKINAADEVITSIDQRVDQLVQKLERLKQRQCTLALDFNQLDQQKAAIAAQVQARKDQLARLEDATQAAADEVNRLQVAKIEMESKRSQSLSQASYYDEMLTDIAANSEQKIQQIREAETAVTQLSDNLHRDECSLKEMFDRRQQESTALQDLRRHHDEMMTGITDRETQVKELRRAREQAADEGHKKELAATEINAKLEQMEERVRIEYSLDVRELQATAPDPNLSAEQAAAYVEELRDRLQNMGIVNLLALDEYTQQKERQEFLSRQLDDLIAAKSTLNATIQKINQAAMIMFMETMEKARANFKAMYEELFTGGEADVILVDPNDPLESPIEIISRPRGKRPLTIMQLSGGERALTAISLLFALYLVKPSPFCFLDEIDAPLDDVNVGRFLSIVRKFSGQTQFIIITHNKITMEAADTLYGVTMEEPGVSKVVAVRFKRPEESEDNDTILDLHYAQEDDLMQAG